MEDFMENTTRINKINKVKEALDKAKTQHATLTGSLENYKTTLLQEFGVETVKEAKTKLEKMTKELDKLNEQITTELPAIEESLKDYM
jgi:uncharacterized phage infection (PIP) family protein YhgE